MVGLVKDVGGWFNSYRYKFHIGIVKFAEQFELANNNNVTEYDELLEEFVTEDVWKKILQMYLKATNLQQLKKDKLILSKLGLFVRQVVQAVLIARKHSEDTQSVIKKFDEHTID